MLAGLPRAPSRFNPRTDPQAAAARTTRGAGRHGRDRRHYPGAGHRGREQNTIFGALGGGWFADWAAAQADAQIPPGTDAVLRATLDSRTQTWPKPACAGCSMGLE